MNDPRAVTMGASGGALFALIILTGVLSYYGIDLGPNFAGAVVGAITSILGVFMHSTRVQEDAAALHARILAELRRDLPPVATQPPAPIHPIVGGDH